MAHLFLPLMLAHIPPPFTRFSDRALIVFRDLSSICSSADKTPFHGLHNKSIGVSSRISSRIRMTNDRPPEYVVRHYISE